MICGDEGCEDYLKIKESRLVYLGVMDMELVIEFNYELDNSTELEGYEIVLEGLEKDVDYFYSFESY